MEAVTDGAVVVRGLRKSYGHFEAVRGIDFTVARGEVFSLLGPNGAGKTTTMEMLEGYRERTSGEAWVLGMDPQSRDRGFRERVGIVLQDIAVDAYLTVREVVARNAGYYPNPRNVDETIELVGLKEKANSRINKLSGGQQRRLDLALGIIGNPDLLFLDEPTTGFDPNARRGAWEVIRGLREGGTTILLTTHYMDEAQALADHVAVIAAGEIVAAGTPDTIGGRQQAAVRIRFLLPAGTEPAHLPMPVQRNGEWVEIQTDEPTPVLHHLTGWALDRGLELPGLEVDRPTLEDIYLELTGAAARAGAPGSEREGTGPGGRGVNSAALIAHQVKYENKAYWRNPRAAIFTVAFPLMFLVIFASLQKTSKISFLPGVNYNQYFVPAIGTYGIVMACYANLGITTAIKRDAGIFKRLQGTPLPSFALISGMVVLAFFLALIIFAITVTVGVLFYDVTMTSQVAQLILVLALGAFCFCSLGIAVGNLIPNAEAAPAIINFVILPVLFISGVFYPIDDNSTIARVASWLPVRPLVSQTTQLFMPSSVTVGGGRVVHYANGLDGGDLLTLLIWTAVGLYLAITKFRWEPNRS